MSHKIAKQARLLLKLDSSRITHADMRKAINKRIKTAKVPGLGDVSYTTYTLVHAKGSYRQVYQQLKRELRV